MGLQQGRGQKGLVLAVDYGSVKSSRVGVRN